MALDLAGVACSVGAACSSGSTELSPTLRAMDLPKELVASSLRFSLGATTTQSEIDEAVRRIIHVCRQLQGPYEKTGPISARLTDGQDERTTERTRDDQPARPRRQNRFVSPEHPGACLAADVDLPVGVEDGRQQGLRRRLVQQLAVGQRDHVGGHFVGQLSGGMGAHAVANHEEMAALLEIRLVAGQHHGIRILVIRPAQPDIGQCGTIETVIPDGRGLVHVTIIAALLGDHQPGG